MLLSHLLVAVLAAFLSVGCERSTPTGPDVSGPLTALFIFEWRFPTTTETTARVMARWGINHRDSRTREVTAEAVWASSAPEIMAVSAPGRLVSVAPGEAELQITFGRTLKWRVRVFPDEPPRPILETGNVSEVASFIRDDSRVGIEGVTVEIIHGHNTGRVAVTGAGGLYRFFPPLVCGPVTARASKPGYRDAVAESVLCVDGLPQFRMIPESLIPLPMTLFRTRRVTDE